MIFYITILLLIITAIDFRKRKIPNPLILILFFSILAYQLTVNIHFIGHYALSFFITFILFFLLYLVRYLGAGDVKLIASLSLFFIFPLTLYYWLLIISFGVITSLAHVVYKKGCQRVSQLITRVFLFNGKGLPHTEKEEQVLSFPFSIVILIAWGVAVGWFL
ncbi:prepilin peptidase [Alteribacter populi]|uniref:prepilin peptidase n=1 Tax=Alteribacter populi TaxID=2011011 RepID=UPI000BBA9749|nr:prepilin peptidase [Alteribacter populi]